jgi:hypothetical protein
MGAQGGSDGRDLAAYEDLFVRDPYADLGLGVRRDLSSAVRWWTESANVELPYTLASRTPCEERQPIGLARGLRLFQLVRRWLFLRRLCIGWVPMPTPKFQARNTPESCSSSYDTPVRCSSVPSYVGPDETRKRANLTERTRQSAAAKKRQIAHAHNIGMIVLRYCRYLSDSVRPHANNPDRHHSIDGRGYGHGPVT